MNTLDGILGQENAVSVLTRQLESGRLAHSYLFVGPAGTGKTTAAVAFAKSLLCTDGGCGKCSTCRRADTGVHPDMHVIRREKDTAEIKIGQIRDLQSTLGLTAFEAGRKVAIIDEAERLNPEASNAFLKTLEEPSPDTVLILVATNTSSLLDTIVSRCRMVRFRPLPDAAVREILVAGGIDDRQAVTASALAAGSVTRAFALTDSSDTAGDRRWLVEHIPALKQHNPVELADELLARCPKTPAQKRESVITYLGFLTFLMRDVRVAQTGASPPHWYTDDAMPVVETLTGLLSARETAAILRSIDRCRQEVSANVRPDLSLTQLFVTISEAIT